MSEYTDKVEAVRNHQRVINLVFQTLDTLATDLEDFVVNGEEIKDLLRKKREALDKDLWSIVRWDSDSSPWDSEANSLEMPLEVRRMGKNEWRPWYVYASITPSDIVYFYISTVAPTQEDK